MDGIPIVRPKSYGKTIEFFVSEGVSKTGVNEPLSQVFTSKSHKNKFKRKVIASKTKKLLLVLKQVSMVQFY